MSVGLCKPEEQKQKNAGVDVFFSVVDTGIGIPMNQRQRIFEAFMQKEGQKTAAYGGTGLGLAISRKLVSMMAGEITVTGNPPGGSVFTVTLKDVNVGETSAEKEAFAGIADAPVRFEPASLLVADDDAANRRLIKTYLRDTGLDVFEAANGLEAVAQVSTHAPAVVLMGLKMPKMGGIEASRILKDDSRSRHIPIIIVTATPMKDQGTMLKDVPCDGILNKPIIKEELIARLKPFLSHDAETPNEATETADLTIALPEDDTVDTGKSPPPAPTELSGLSEAVRKNDMAGRSRLLSQTLFLDELEIFAGETRKLADEPRWEPWTAWNNRFTVDLRSFDMCRIADTLERFQKLIDQLESLVESEA